MTVLEAAELAREINIFFKVFLILEEILQIIYSNPVHFLIL